MSVLDNGNFKVVRPSKKGKYVRNDRTTRIRRKVVNKVLSLIDRIIKDDEEGQTNDLQTELFCLKTQIENIYERELEEYE